MPLSAPERPRFSFQSEEATAEAPHDFYPFQSASVGLSRFSQPPGCDFSSRDARVPFDPSAAFNLPGLGRAHPQMEPGNYARNASTGQLERVELPPQPQRQSHFDVYARTIEKFPRAPPPGQSMPLGNYARNPETAEFELVEGQ